MKQTGVVRSRINPVLGLWLALAICILGMLSVYLAGNARGYNPSFSVLLRNAFLMSFFLAVFGILKRSYKGDFSILVVVAILTGIGFVVQYRTSSAINVGFQKTLVEQYSSAMASAQLDSVSADTSASSLIPRSAQQERKLRAIGDEAKQLLRLDEFSWGRLLRDMIQGIPGWSRLIVAHLLALLSMVYVIRKCAKKDFEDTLNRPFFWMALTVVLLLVFVALSEVGARGRFVYKMTPWEAFKITIIIFLSGFFARFKDDFTRKARVVKGKKFKSQLMLWGPFVLIWLIPQALFVLLKDFGQIIIYGGLVVIMIFAVTRRYLFMVSGVLVTVIASKSIFMLEGLVPPHVLQRFIIWGDVWRMPHDAAWWDDVYQIMNSFFALHAGGLTGSGLGLGYPTNIPLVVSDFVYSAIAEELGFIGCFLLVMAYLLLFFLGMRVAIKAGTEFERLLALGFTAMLAIQVFVNIGGVIKLIPLTGITLPFISRGGFSFLISCIIVGFLMGISHRNGAAQAS